MNIQPYYFALTDFGDLGLGHASDPCSFDDACDAFAEQMDKERPSLVFRVEMNGAPKMTDVTADAHLRIIERRRQRHEDAPEWAVTNYQPDNSVSIAAE